jgi:hypothetical protein
MFWTDDRWICGQRFGQIAEQFQRASAAAARESRRPINSAGF